MFEQLAAEQIIRDVAPLTAQYRERFDVFDRRGGSVAVVVEVTARNNGSITATLRGSWDGGDTFVSALASGTLSTGSEGVVYLLPAGTIPPDLRIVVDPSNDFDGNVQVAIRSAGLTRRLD